MIRTSGLLYIIPYVLSFVLLFSCNKDKEDHSSGGHPGYDSIAHVYFDWIDVGLFEGTFEHPDTSTMFKRAWEYFEGIEEDYAIGVLHEYAGRYYSTVDSVDLTIDHAVKAVELYQQTGAKEFEAWTHLLLGNTYWLRTNYIQAQKESELAFNIGEELKDTAIMGWSLLNSAISFAEVENYTAADEFYRRTQELLDLKYDPDLQTCIDVNIAVGYTERERYESSERLLLRSIDSAMHYEYYNYESLALLNLAEVYNKSEKYDKALELCQRWETKFSDAEQLLGTPTMTSSLSILHVQYGLANVGKRNFEIAKAHLDKGLSIARKAELPFEEANALEARSAFYEAIGDYEKSLEVFKEFKDTRESFAGISITRELQDLLAQSELNEKDQEIARLEYEESLTEARGKRKRNFILFSALFLFTALASLFAGIRNKLRTKMAEQKLTIVEGKLQVLQSQMNPHFIHNAVNGIQNFILKSQKMEAYEYLGEFSSLLRMITKSSVSNKISLRDELEFIKTYVKLEQLRFRDSFSTSFDVQAELLTIDPDIPSMMIQPVIENAILHGVSNLDYEGRIDVRLKQDGEGLKCIVKDNGRGRIAAGIAKQQAKKEKHLSIATVNTEDRIDFLHTIGYERADVFIEDLYEQGEPSGTMVTIYLPFLTD